MKSRISAVKAAGSKILRFLKSFAASLFPTFKDNIKQAAIKLAFLFMVALLVVSEIGIIAEVDAGREHTAVLQQFREIWYKKGATKSRSYQRIKALNEDFAAWIKIEGTNVDNPVFQALDNEFYSNRNGLKQSSKYGAVYFDCNDRITDYRDINFTLYGNNMPNGGMFAELSKYKSIEFYKEHPNIDFYMPYTNEVYKIYAVFVLNSDPADDDGYLYDITRNRFDDEIDFGTWVDCARARSIIDTTVDVKYGDKILSLVTESEAFDGARFVIMARCRRYGEAEETDTSGAAINPNPQYPKRWYEDNKFDYPY